MLISVLIFSCNKSKEIFNESEKAAVTIEVRLMLDEYFVAIGHGGLQAEFDYLDHSPEFF